MLRSVELRAAELGLHPVGDRGGYFQFLYR